MRRVKLIVVLGALVALLTGVGVAMATTGATTGYPQPKSSSPPRSRRPTSSATSSPRSAPAPASAAAR
jgi:hypothetical protein